MLGKIPEILFLTAAMSCFPPGGIAGSWDYLGQAPPGRTAQVFAPDILGHLAHSSPSFTLDGREMYWSIVSEGGDTRKICVVRYDESRWSEPQIVSFSGSHHDDQPYISPDGRTMFFASKRPKSSDGPSENDIWKVEKTELGWSAPQLVEDSVGIWTPTVTRTGTLYYLGTTEEFGPGIYRTEKASDGYSSPEFLPEQINRQGAQDWCPYIAPDESYLLFSSDRDGGFGSGDVYVCFRNPEGVWGDAVNMGDSINTDLQERFPGVSPDGRYLFFTRWLGPPSHHDLYWIDAAVIDDLRGNAP